jgi:ribosomal-protein-alanine N-acetyltransferase
VICSVRNGFMRIDTARLGLRRFSPADAQEVQRLAGEREIAESTLLPHPYADGMAESWLAEQAAELADGTAVNLAIERTCDATLIGSIGLEIDLEPRRARLGCWSGRPYWGRGYCTEAARAVIAYGFDVLKLERVWAARFGWNAASARVLDKSGFAQEGCRREYVAARGRKEIVVTHGLLRWEWEAQRACPASGRERAAYAST